MAAEPPAKLWSATGPVSREKPERPELSVLTIVGEPAAREMEPDPIPRTL